MAQPEQPRGILQLTGSDKHSFLSNLITNEIIPPLVVDQISSDSDDILSRLADPNSKKKSVRGLVYGRVQMGKTTSYSMLINKSIDAGYKLIIVLGITILVEMLQNLTTRNFSYQDLLYNFLGIYIAIAVYYFFIIIKNKKN